jgi:hypothetical protein
LEGHENNFRQLLMAEKEIKQEDNKKDENSKSTNRRKK